MKVTDYMIQVGTTAEGKIIEIPDVFIAGFVITVGCILAYLFFSRK
tara:strand:+ start:729 stop:866 length:138 start_codon:yes stop_codon:yes gene_type:complete